MLYFPRPRVRGAPDGATTSGHEEAQVMSTILAAIVLIVTAAPTAEQPDNSWVRRLASPPLVDDGVCPRLSYESSLAYDTRRRVFVMWGGHEMRTDSPQQDDTWIYDPAANRWHKALTDRAPVGSCCVRDSAYDESAGAVVQFEGHHGNHGWQLRREMPARLSAPWLFDADTEQWTPMRPVRAPKTRPYKGLVYDSKHQATILFSGEGASNDTWAYDAWTNTWTDMHPTPAPPRRLAPGFAFHRDAGLAVLFGSSSYQNLNDTWTYDLAANRWTPLDTKNPPPKGGSPILVYDSVNRTLVAFYGRKKEPPRVFEFDLAARTWTERPQQEPAPLYDDFVVAFSPRDNLFLVGPGHDSWETGHATVRETWTYRLRRAQEEGGGRVRPQRLPAPANLRLKTARDAVTLDWDPVPGAVTYIILRGEGEVPWRVRFERTGTTPMAECTFRDPLIAPGRIYYYAVLALDDRGRESERSRFVRTQPRVPMGVVAAVLSEDEVRLTWPRPPDPSVVGYVIDRAACASRTEQGTFARLTTRPIAGPTFTDRVSLKADAAGRRPLYAYVLRAVDARGIESGPSSMVFTTPSDPARPTVTEREDGQVVLNWKPNPEPVKGYLIWRMDSARDRGRLITPEPVTGTTYTDASVKGAAMRRYWLVAVDTLGQSGIPGSPAWAFRQSTAMPLD
jgi:hypothetical protein